MKQRKLVPWLIGAAVTLIVVNILVDKFYKPRYSVPEEKINLTDHEVLARFNKSVYSFGLDSTYIKISEKKDNKKISVFLPADLPIPLIINELNSNFDGTSVEVSSIEKKINGNTVIDLIDDNKKILSAEFAYEKSAKRKVGFLGLLIEDMQSLNQNDIATVLNSSESFAALLVPSESSKKFSQKIIEAKKEFIVLLNDEINELDYKLNENYSEKRIKNSVRNIVGSFSQAIFFVIDDNSALSESSIYPLIESEITRRGINLIKLSSIAEIEINQDKNNSNLKELLAALNENEKMLVLADADKFSELWPEISSYRKIGYKFINPSLITASQLN